MKAGVAVALALLAATGCSRPLPEEGSPQAALYRERCSGCHVLFQPASLGPAMWEFQMKNMDSKIRGGGRTPPTGAEKAEILDYLRRHAGGS